MAMTTTRVRKEKEGGEEGQQSDWLSHCGVGEGADFEGWGRDHSKQA